MWSLLGDLSKQASPDFRAQSALESGAPLRRPNYEQLSDLCVLCPSTPPRPGTKVH